MTIVPVVCDDPRTFWTLVRDTLDRIEAGASGHCLRHFGWPEPTQVTHVRLGVRFDWIKS